MHTVTTLNAIKYNTFCMHVLAHYNELSVFVANDVIHAMLR